MVQESFINNRLHASFSCADLTSSKLTNSSPDSYSYNDTANQAEYSQESVPGRRALSLSDLSADQSSTTSSTIDSRSSSSLWRNPCFHNLSSESLDKLEKDWRRSKESSEHFVPIHPASANTTPPLTLERQANQWRESFQHLSSNSLHALDEEASNVHMEEDHGPYQHDYENNFIMYDSVDHEGITFNSTLENPIQSTFMLTMLDSPLL
eukprot:CAMPEP_0202479028 /NCGR_PEP_ID=MMETSP1360-20130828/94770_1 /ASSEMBLY_ACC=CAM_ASM_000848 /TAXON_ID=515479 /ORGANISM="Licmophora paradoxa, Strain CCMP2313" /LENGTH=208 /DNA_ID=CAMNT_0049106337 /DNA_START=100 /DNA_END=724 /DNA_ORIENTATION=-